MSPASRHHCGAGAPPAKDCGAGAPPASYWNMLVSAARSRRGACTTIPSRRGVYITMMVSAFILLEAVASQAADRIILRNLQVITDQTVTAMDEDGVRLGANRVLAWDEIEKGKITPQHQAKFDELLKSLGNPLYRIRQRLKVGDYEGLAKYAEEVYPRYSSRNSATAYMVAQAVMWSRISLGQREQAVEPYLRCLEILRSEPAHANKLPGKRRLQFDAKTGLTRELVPVWFDEEAAKQAMEPVLQAVTAQKKPLLVAGRVYYGTLAMTAGETTRGKQVLDGIESTSEILTQLKELFATQQMVAAGDTKSAVKKLENLLPTVQIPLRPLALYWLGRAEVRQEGTPEKRDGLLHLLRIPAEYAEEDPTLAAAALELASRTLTELGDSQGSRAVRKELFDRYAQTYHARKLQASIQQSANDPSRAGATP